LWILAVCIVGYAAWGLIFGDHGIIHLRKLGAREAVLKREIAEARGRVDELKAEAANIDETRQTRARLNYDMARGDEIIYKTQSGDSGAAGTRNNAAGTRDASGDRGVQGGRGSDNLGGPNHP
jgi:cell division protein FtsB